MSTHNLKPGDRVRLTEQCRVQQCQPGDKGTVWSGPHPTPGYGLHYYVWMDTNLLGDTPIAFHADEIEPDV
jgi:hypothetical protein